MTAAEDTDIEWLERDSREWVLFAHQPDQLTARMTCTYLEAGGVEARVASHSGRYCVEVPAAQLENAMQVYSPVESGVLPAMQEDSRKTGIHTGTFLREQLKKQPAPKPQARGSGVGRWLLRLVVMAVLAGLIFLILSS